MFANLAYGLEGIRQTEELQYELDHQQAIIQDRNAQIEMLEVILDHQEEPTEVYAGEFEITYYCPCAKCCGPDAVGITYTGTVAQEGKTIAVDPEVIELGSTIFIDGAEYIAEDTGAVIKGNKIDIYKDSHTVALEGGRHMAKVYVLGDVYGKN